MKDQTLLMLDTETVTNFRLPYDVAFVKFCPIRGVLEKQHFFVRECLQYILRYTAKKGKPPLYWPDKLNPALLIKAKNCESAVEILSRFNNAAGECDKVVAHNVNFDLTAMQNMADKWAEGEKVRQCETLELSGFFPDYLSKEYGEKVPYTKTGLATFKADFFMPLLGNLVQGHDALGDVMNQIAVWQMVCNSRYTGKMTIFHNMLAYQKQKHENARFVGIGFIPGIVAEKE